MLEHYQAKHGRKPDKIVIAPLALVGLAIKKSVATTWDGIPVECRLFKADEVASKNQKAKVVSLGVFMKENRGRMVLAACDLKATDEAVPPAP